MCLPILSNTLKNVLVLMTLKTFEREEANGFIQLQFTLITTQILSDLK